MKQMDQLKVAFGALVLSAAGMAAAAPITCSVSDATANGAIADQCAGDDGTGVAGNDGGSLAAFVNGAFTGDALSFVSKYNNGSGTEAGGMAGYALTVTENNQNGYLFQYSLSVPAAAVGTVVDWVLGVKQSTNSYLFYLFEDVTLGIDGGFNNFWLNRQDKLVNDYSFAAGFIRAADPPNETPEPGSLALLGIALLGATALRRRRS